LGHLFRTLIDCEEDRVLRAVLVGMTGRPVVASGADRAVAKSLKKVHPISR